MNNDHVSASIIICTYNRAKFLRQLLSSLTHLTGEKFEVVVVNGPSTDETESVLELYNGRIKVVDCPNRNISQSRNLGIAAAAGNIVVFIDDDALPCDEKWVERYISRFQDDRSGKLAVLGGPVWHRDTGLAEFNGGSITEYGFQIFGNNYDDQRNDSNEKWYPGIAGGNAAFLRKVLVEIGGFDEFYAYYMDESDVCIRIARAGYKIENISENGIRHYKEELRTKPINISWEMITRSDTYFEIKNAQDPFVKKLLKTLFNAPRKHFLRKLTSSLPIKRFLFLYG